MATEVWLHHGISIYDVGEKKLVHASVLLIHPTKMHENSMYSGGYIFKFDMWLRLIYIQIVY